jgi:hypothetical protein
VSPSTEVATRRQHRHEILAEHGVEHLGIDLVGLADIAEIDRLLDVRIRIAGGAGDLGRLDHVAVLAAQADRLAAGGVDEADDLLVDRAGEDHLDDLHRLLVGDPEAVDELALDAELGQHLADLGPAAVDDHRIDAGLFQHHDVAGEGARAALVAHGMAAIFHHDDLLVVFSACRAAPR